MKVVNVNRYPNQPKTRPITSQRKIAFVSRAENSAVLDRDH